jgi:hypothetical protein
MQDSDVVFKMKGKKLFITDELEKFWDACFCLKNFVKNICFITFVGA